MKAGFNKEWAKKLTRNQFIDRLKHHAHQLDLGKEYDNLFPAKKNSKSKNKNVDLNDGSSSTKEL